MSILSLAAPRSLLSERRLTVFNILKKFQIFLRERPWISPWIQLTSNELNITVHVITSQFSSYCDVTNKRFWRHQQNVNPAIEARGRCVKIVVFIVIFIVVMSCKKYNDVLLEWQIVSVFTRVLLWCLFPELRSTKTVCHSSTHIILNLSHTKHIHLHTLRLVHSTLQIYWKKSCELYMHTGILLDSRTNSFGIQW